MAKTKQSLPTLVSWATAVVKELEGADNTVVYANLEAKKFAIKSLKQLAKTLRNVPVKE